ncbi:MAG: protein phosphatase 2C domain-containing protein [Chromatiales bacterium]|nr:protein phosphatase 2C domain-containing protein [Chromatiales bacterium]
MIKYQYQSAQVSLIGDRKINQDRCAVIDHDEALFLALGDGMGGHPRGEVAAQILIDTAEQQLYRTPLPILSPGSFLTRVLHKAHETIMAYGYDQTPPIDPRTTAVICLIQDDVAYWAHAGDSRLYLFRDGQIAFRTTDDSYVERLRQKGVISATETESHPQRNYVTRCLGGTLISPELTLGKHSLTTGDNLLLCSDGLWGSMSEAETTAIMSSDQNLDERLNLLAETAAQNAYPESDNVTLLGIEIGKAVKPRPEAISPAAQQEKKQDELNSAIAELQQAIESFQSEIDED